MPPPTREDKNRVMAALLRSSDDGQDLAWQACQERIVQARWKPIPSGPATARASLQSRSRHRMGHVRWHKQLKSRLTLLFLIAASVVSPLATKPQIPAPSATVPVSIIVTAQSRNKNTPPA